MDNTLFEQKEITHDPELILTALEQVLQSRCFRSRKILKKLLAYIVEQSLAGQAQQLSQYTLATEGLGKAADFSPDTDPIIRIQVGRLRKQLTDYYATEGRFDPVWIDIPTGSYQPLFVLKTLKQPPIVVADSVTSPSLSQGPNLMCIPRNFVADEAVGWAFVARLTQDYVNLLTRFNFCQILLAEQWLWEQCQQLSNAWHDSEADYALFFDLHYREHGYWLQCSLMHKRETQALWTQTFHLGAQYPEPMLRHKVFKRIAHDTITYDPGIIHTHWAAQLLNSGKPVAAHHQVLTSVRQYIWEPSPVTFQASFRACEQRLEAFPHDTQAWLIYALHCFTEYGVKFNIVDSPHTKIIQSASVLLQLAPNNAYSYTYHALQCLIEDDQQQCLHALQTALTINSLDSYLNVQIGLLYLAMDDWQTGSQFIQDTITISSLYPDWYHIPLSIAYYREGHYLKALDEARKIRLKHLWTPLLRTALYHCNHKLHQGKQEYHYLLQEHPEFAQTAATIVQNFPNKINAVLNQLLSHLPG